MLYDQTISPEKWIVTIAARLYMYLTVEMKNRSINIVDLIDYAEAEGIPVVKADFAINWLHLIGVLSFDEKGVIVI